MDIIINTENIFNDVGSKFLQELQTTDPIPPRGTMIQNLNEANARLVLIIGRYLDPGCQWEADDSLATGERFLYHFLLTTRRGASKTQALADIIHSYLVNATLTKCYSIMNLKDLAATHDSQVSADAEVISQLLNSKLPPV